MQAPPTLVLQPSKCSLEPFRPNEKEPSLELRTKSVGKIHYTTKDELKKKQEGKPLETRAVKSHFWVIIDILESF